MSPIEKALAPMFEPENLERIQTALRGELQRNAGRAASSLNRLQIPPEVRERINREIEEMRVLSGAAGRAVAPDRRRD